MLNRKFHNVNNWYQFLTARDIFRTNISHYVENTHEVKFHEACIRIPHIDKMRPPSPHFCCILHSIPILHSFVTDICNK